jgi:Fe2+ or Zn2+ uptake regulation protein
MLETRFKNTTQRAEVLEEVRRSQQHLTAGEIFERVRRRDPRIGYGTVYRTLHLLAEHGLIQELTFADQASRYDARIERHDHVHCLNCGVLHDVDVPVALIARHVAAEQSGFEITSHHTVFAGQCPACRSRGVEKSRSRAGDAKAENRSPIANGEETGRREQ